MRRFHALLAVGMLSAAAASNHDSIYRLSRDLARSLPPPGPWHCQVEKRMTYCCPSETQLVSDLRVKWMCRSAASRYTDATVLYRFQGDTQ